MARTATLAELRQSVLVAGGWENSADLTPAVLNEYINKAVAKIWRLLVKKGADYCTQRATLTTTPNSDAVTVGWPATFQKLRKLELQEGSDYTKLRPTSLDAAHRFRAGGRGYRYWLEANVLYLAPTPTVADTLRLFYIPYAVKMTNDADTFDGINGYEELVILWAKMYCERRQEMPEWQATWTEIQEAAADIKADADDRDAAEPFYLNANGPDDDPEDDEPWL
jgi:hypothetical protein